MVKLKQPSEQVREIVLRACLDWLLHFDLQAKSHKLEVLNYGFWLMFTILA